MIEIDRSCSQIKKGMSAFKIFTFIKNTSGRHRQRWENNIRMDLKEIGINTSNMVDSAQDSDSDRSLSCNCTC